MNYKELNIKLQVTGGFKLVTPRLGAVKVTLKPVPVLRVLTAGFSLPGHLFVTNNNRVAIDMSTGSPRLLINPPISYRGWIARKVNNETTRHTVLSKKLQLFLRTALKLNLKGAVDCRLIGPHFENGVVIYDIKK